MLQSAWMRRSAILACIRYALGLTATALLASSSWAQIAGVNDQTATPTAGIGHNYIHMLNETVNPSNGSVSVRIQVPVPKGRGLTLPFGFAYDSGGTWAPGVDASDLALFGYNPALSMQSQGSGGWSYSLPLGSMTGNYLGSSGEPLEDECPEETGFVFQDPSGGRYSLGLRALDVGYESNNLHSFPCGRGTSPPSIGGTDFYSARVEGFKQTLSVANADGTTYRFTSLSDGGGCVNGTGGDASTAQALPSLVEDRNGNQVVFSAPTSCSGAFTETDSAGRVVLSSSGFGASGNTVTVSGLPEPYTLTWASEPYKTALGSTLREQPNSLCGNNINNVSGSLPRITVITLPNGEEYSFSYDSVTGLLSRITYPTGGYVSYTWAVNPQSELASLPDFNGDTAACPYTYDTYVVSQRSVSYDGSTIALQQNFSYGATAWNSSFTGWTSKSTTVTTQDFIQGISYTTVYNYSPMNAPPIPDIDNVAPQIPMEQTVIYNDQSGHTLRTMTKNWNDIYELANEQVTLDNGLTSEVAYTYGPGGQVTEKDDYDYGPTLKRKTLTTYQAFGPTPVYPGTASPLFDRPCKVVVEDGGSNAVAETDTLYDGGATVCGTAGTPSTSSASTPSGTHDETNYGPSSSTPRGNATKVTRDCLSGCSTASTTTYAYDEAGQVVSMKDPCGNATCGDMTGTNHTTTYSYTDNDSSCSGAAPPAGNTDAYLTQETNALGQITKYCYGYDDGQLRGSTDENGQTTIYKYADSLRRLTETDFPDGGETSISYNDTPPTPSVTTTRKMNSSQSVVSTTIANGMGLPIETELTDPQGTDFSVTAYDGVGEEHTVTNPHRSGDTVYSTSHTYDALGRTTQVTETDGSVISTSYSGNCTTVTDEAGIKRQSCTDGLGRMTSVTEDPSGLGYVTNYTYDTLDDLLSVTQNGSHSRSFSYDSLKRLTSSTNPEAGTVTYTYDANSNVATKIDGRNITTTNTYDALDRTTETQYSDGTTPTIYLNYDGSTQTNCKAGITDSNPKGERTGMCDAAGSEAWSHDSMGRTLTDQRTTVAGVSLTRSFGYTYNLAGSVASIAYPSGLSLTYTYDGAGRPANVKDQNGNTYAAGSCGTSGVCYTAAGAMQTATLDATANFAGFTVADSYNPRLQPSELKITGGSSTFMDYSYCFYALTSGACPASGTTNNGNVRAVLDGVTSTRSQTFSYDTLNRLATGASVATSGTNCWGEQYGYDAWGNLLSIGALTGYSACAQPDNLSVSVTTANQISGYTYDAAGNLTAIPGTGGATYTYNAESEMTTSSAGFSYTYDGDGKRAKKSGAMVYWYGMTSTPLEETNPNGAVQNDYIFFGGERIARLDASGDIFAYFEDHLGSSRKMREIASGATTSTAAYDADFYPFGREHTFTNGSPIYKFEGKIRDAETGLDDFGARYYSFTIGRFISADWSAVPAPVPYANLTNPQTLNLYAMVSDNPETFADLDGHTQYDLTPSGTCEGECNGTNAAPGSADNPDVSDDQNKQPPPSENQAPAPPQQQAQQQNQATGNQNQPQQSAPKPGPAPKNPDGTPKPPNITPPEGHEWKWIPGSGPKGGGRWILDPPAPSPDGKGGRPQVVWDPEDGYWTHDNGGGRRTHWDPEETDRQIIKTTAVGAAAVGTGVVIWHVLEALGAGALAF